MKGGGEEVVRKRLMGLTGGVGIDKLVIIILVDALSYGPSLPPSLKTP